MKLVRSTFAFVLLLGFWIALSGHYSVLFGAMGVVSAAVCTWFASRLLESTVGGAERHPRIHLFWLFIYCGWLLGRMAVGAVQVAHIVLNPKKPPQPGILQFRTQLSSPAARTMLANSITLVPGTITLDVEGDLLTVHSFTPNAVDDLADANMQNRIAAVFREPDQPIPDLIWELGEEAPADTDPEAREGFVADQGGSA
ncbi:MAG: Na+/H+ antiporter subunit E [Nitriliruptoraceae bacterium]